MITVTNYDWGHISIDKWVSHMANNAGGVSVKLSVANYGKPVKKYTIYFKAYNGANELVECTVSNISVRGVSSADYLGTGKTEHDLIFENAWYNHSIRSVRINRIEVVYNDGNTETCRGNHHLSEEELKQKEISEQKTKQSEQKTKQEIKEFERQKQKVDSIEALIGIAVLFLIYVILKGLWNSLF